MIVSIQNDHTVLLCAYLENTIGRQQYKVVFRNQAAHDFGLVLPVNFL